MCLSVQRMRASSGVGSFRTSNWMPYFFSSAESVFSSAPGDQADGGALLADAAGAADAVEVDPILRQRIIEDVRQIADVDPARGDVRRHQEAEPALARRHHPLARVLGEIAVQQLGVEPLAVQDARDQLRLVARVAEDDRALGVLALNHAEQVARPRTRSRPVVRTCWMSSATCGPTKRMSSGSRRRFCARRSMSGGTVAEKSSVCRSFGSVVEDPRQLGSKNPTESISSASSRTAIRVDVLEIAPARCGRARGPACRR